MAGEIEKRMVEHAREDLARIGTGAAGHYSQPETVREDKRGIWQKVKDYFSDRVLPEVGQMLVQKTAQGSAELSQFLNQGNAAYTPYGYAQKPLDPLEIEGPGVSYQQMLREAAERQGQEHDRGMGR